MDPMHDDEDLTLNAKAIGLAVGGAALAGLLFVLARRDDRQEPAERIHAAYDDVKDEAKKAAKAAKKRRKALGQAAADQRERIAHDVREATAPHHFDVKAAERDLKAAAWDAHQEAQEAESRLRSAGNRVVGDATHLASRVGQEARSLAGEGRERISHLRHRDDAGHSEADELTRLRAEVESLRRQLGGTGRKAERDYAGLVSKLTGKTGPIPESMASEAVSAALAQFERSLKAKGPALLAARDRKQVLEILQAELGPTLRDSMLQAAAAALGIWDTTRERAGEVHREAERRASETAQEIRESSRVPREMVREDVVETIRTVEDEAKAATANGKHRFWHGHDRDHVVAIESVTAGATEEEAHRSKAGLFWGGAGLGLALYALLDAERRENVLRLANEASIQVQELVRDLQGYDDEFS